MSLGPPRRVHDLCLSASVRGLSVSNDAVVLWIAWADPSCRALAPEWCQIGGSKNGHLHPAAQIAEASVIAVSKFESSVFCAEQRHPVAPRCCDTGKYSYSCTKTEEFPVKIARSRLSYCTTICEIGHHYQRRQSFSILLLFAIIGTSWFCPKH